MDIDHASPPVNITKRNDIDEVWRPAKRWIKRWTRWVLEARHYIRKMIPQYRYISGQNMVRHPRKLEVVHQLYTRPYRCMADSGKPWKWTESKYKIITFLVLRF